MLSYVTSGNAVAQLRSEIVGKHLVELLQLGLDDCPGIGFVMSRLPVSAS